MQRRKFNSLITAGLGVTATACHPNISSSITDRPSQSIKPQRLQKNDLVGLISPGSFIDDEGLERAVNNLEDLGLKVKLGKHIRSEYGYVAGKDKERINDLHGAFRDKEIKAVWCVRGGYGCSRLLPALDFKLIRENPKILIGYSDITALLNAIYFKTGLVGFHGPVGASEMTDFNRRHIEAVLMEGKTELTIHRPESFAEKDNAEYEQYSIRRGQAEGILLGGNLSLLAAMAGTGYLPDFNQFLVFIEDVGEKPYRIDRMLTQLRQSNALSGAAGIALGVFAGCSPKPDDRSLSLAETLEDRLGTMKVPTAYGIPFGHIDDQCVLPIGIKARLDAGTGILTLLESAVS